VQVSMPVAHPRQRHRIPHQRVAIERTEHLPANVRSQQKNLLRHHRGNVIGPHRVLQLDAAIKLLQRSQRLYANIGSHPCCRNGQLVTPSFFSEDFACAHSDSNSSGASRCRPSRPPAARSIAAKRARNFALLRRNADSASTFRWRARFIAVNIRSPNSASTFPSCFASTSTINSAISSSIFANKPDLSGQSKPTFAAFEPSL